MVAICKSRLTIFIHPYSVWESTPRLHIKFQLSKSILNSLHNLQNFNAAVLEAEFSGSSNYVDIKTLLYKSIPRITKIPSRFEKSPDKKVLFVIFLKVQKIVSKSTLEKRSFLIPFFKSLGTLPIKLFHLDFIQILK